MSDIIEKLALALAEIDRLELNPYDDGKSQELRDSIRTDLEESIAALRVAQQAKVPAGFVMVPAKPTTDQLIAGAKALFRRHGTHNGIVGEMYAAMLAVAQSAQEGKA